jgi:hypothetical protein
MPKRTGPLLVVFVACVWLNQSVGRPTWEGIRDGVFSDPGAHVFQALRYPFIYLYRRSADEALYYGTAAQILGQPYQKEIVAQHSRGRVTGVEDFDLPPPPTDGRFHSPWSEVRLEYPPPVLPFVVLPKLWTQGFEAYARMFGLLMGLCMAAAIALAIDVLRRADPARASFDARWWLGAGLLLAQGALTIQRLDPIVALSMMAAVHGAVRRDARAFGFWGGVAGACKIVPLLVVPAIIAADWPFWRARTTQLVAWLGAGLALGLGPMVLVSWRAVCDLVRYHAARGLQIESTLGSLLGAARVVLGTTRQATVSYGSFNLDGAVPDFLAKLALPITLAGVGVLVVLVHRASERQPERDRIARVTRAALAGTIVVWLGGKVFSPQYLTWGIPLVLAIPGRRGVRAVWIAVLAMAVTQLFDRGYYDHLVEQAFVAVYTVVARQIVLIALLVFVAPHARAGERSVARAHARMAL